MQQETFYDRLAAAARDENIDSETRAALLAQLDTLKNTRLNIFIAGAPGVGKSATINALFGDNVAKVGEGIEPETQSVQKYSADNLILWDSPGVEDGSHAQEIAAKLAEKDADGNYVIDLVLVILNAASRDLGSSYALINDVIIPNLGDGSGRLLVALNQCDLAMSGRNWDVQNNMPLPKLEQFLEEKAESVKNRILEATGVQTAPVYYSAGSTLGEEAQPPYNLSKLLRLIVAATPQEKRAVYIDKINTDEKVWEKDDKREDYKQETEKDLLAIFADFFQKTGKAVIEFFADMTALLTGKRR